MTVGEVTRRLAAFTRARTREMRDRAVLDWQLANLTSIAVSRCFSKSVKMPTLEESYPSLFENENESVEINDQQQPLQKDISAIRFMQFASKHNLRKHNEEVLDG